MVQEMPREEAHQLKNSYVWIDWTAIPQMRVRQEDDHDPLSMQASLPPMARAVNSILAYVEACQYFFAICPPLRHVNTGQICDTQSYGRRGWCRMEVAARVHARRSNRRVIIVKG